MPRRRRNSKAKANKIPVTADQFFGMSELAQDKWQRTTQVISKMRDGGFSLAKASREFSLDPRMVVRLGRDGLKKNKSGHYVAKSSDNLLRVVVIPNTDGLREVGIRDSREASLIGRYWAAVQKYLETGDASALQKIGRKTITDADGKRIRLIKDLTELERLGSAGVLSFESLYAKAA